MATVTKDFRIKSGLAVEGNNATVNGSDILTAAAITNGTQSNISVSYDANTKALNFSVDALAIETTGPLTYQNNVLDVVTGDGLEVLDGELTVDIDSSLKFSNTGALGIKLTGNASTGSLAFDIFDGGLYVDVGNGLTYTGTGQIRLSDSYTQDLVGNALTGGTQSGLSVTYDSNSKTVSFDVNDPTITIAGDVDGSATMTNLGNTTINVTLDTVNANVGTFGSSTAIPVVTVNAKGLVTAVGESTISTTLNVAGDSGNTSVALGTDTLTFSGGEGIDVTVANNDTVTIAAEDATTTNKGIASFNSNNFTVTDGAVSANFITLGSSTLELGGNTTSLAGLSQLDVDDITINGNEIAVSNLAVDTTLYLNPGTGGHVNVSASKIINLATPTEASDAATKAYVDGVAEGLHIHESVAVATTGPVNLLEPGDIDGVTLTEGMRVLVKDQNTDAENGIYVVPAGVPIYLTRAADYDSPAEIDAGDFVFVNGGDTNANTGWVQVNTVGIVGTDAVNFTQFSGAGTYLAGNGLSLDGNEFSINDNVVVTHEDLDTYLNSTVGEEGTTILYVQEYVDNAIAIGDATATPTYLALDVNSVAKQVAAEVSASTANVAVTAYQFDASEYRTAKFLVKVAHGAHSEVSEVLLTLDSTDNIAITEYAVVSTNGSASTITADTDSGVVRLRVTPNFASSDIKVYGTLLA